MSDARRNELENCIVDLRCLKRELEKAAPFKKAAVASRIFDTMIEILTDIEVRVHLAEQRIDDLRE